MKNYQEITTHAEMEAFLALVAGFHDSMAKEIRIINRGFVLPDHSMHMGHRFDCQLLIQSQWPPHAIELLACKVLSLNILDAGEFAGATGAVIDSHSPVQKHEIQLRFDSLLSIAAERVFYAVRTEWLGPKARFRGDMPGPEAVDASTLENGWRQCSHCADAWEEALDITFSICPGCQRLTELKTDISFQG